MSTDPGTPTPGPPDGGRAWVRPVLLVVSCLVIGFVGGWIIRGDDGPVTVLAPTPEGDQAEVPVITTGGGGGGTATTGTSTAGTAGGGATAPTTTTAPQEPAAPPDRADIALAVLNGTNTTGLAAQTAGEAEGLGYVGVTTGNAPTSTSPTIVYFRPGQRAAAQRVARDLQVSAVQQLPTSGALSDAAPDGAEVVVVLGPG
ncbi:MAG: LytR C-terminal domain-containing protein [Thermoleophilia bacterium]